MSTTHTTPSSARREDPRVRRAERKITLSLMAIATLMIVGLGVFTDLPTLVRLGSTALMMVAAYPLLRKAFHPRMN